jgi:hypothetical protein
VSGSVHARHFSSAHALPPRLLMHVAQSVPQPAHARMHRSPPPATTQSSQSEPSPTNGAIEDPASLSTQHVSSSGRSSQPFAPADDATDVPSHDAVFLHVPDLPLAEHETGALPSQQRSKQPRPPPFVKHAEHAPPHGAQRWSLQPAPPPFRMQVWHCVAALSPPLPLPPGGAAGLPSQQRAKHAVPPRFDKHEVQSPPHDVQRVAQPSPPALLMQVWHAAAEPASALLHWSGT